MAAYYMISYDIVDEATYRQYGPALGPLFEKYGAEVLVADTRATPVEGTARGMQAIVKFPSRASALACYHSPEYQAIKPLRTDATINGTMVLASDEGDQS
ncbi:DUF1330 domain-containing protein [Chitinophaga lutea]